MTDPLPVNLMISEMTAERLERMRRHAEENLHKVEFTIGPEDITAKIFCTGRGNSACHLSCTVDGEQCECEKPDLEDAGRCLWTEWMSHNCDPIDFHVSDGPQQIKNGGIIVWWQADESEYLWTYKESRQYRPTMNVIESL